MFDRLSRMMEGEVGPYRDELLAGLSGHVVEVGAGNGINFSHYPAEVEHVLALEPEPYMRAKALGAAAAAKIPVTVQDATAAAVPAQTGSADAAIASLVLCTVADSTAALAKLRRVLKPGGEFGEIPGARPCRRIPQSRAAASARPPAYGRWSAAAATARGTPSPRSGAPASPSPRSAASTWVPRGR